MEFQEWINIHQANLPFDKGGMFMKGIKYLDTPMFYRADYNVSGLPYIVYQEEGFTHWITKKLVTKNQYFISRKTVGHINRAIQSDILGLPYPQHKAFGEQTAQRNNSILLSQGGMTI